MTHRSVVNASLPRLLLAALFVLGSDVVLWFNTGARPPLEWLLALIGYVALAFVVLDFAVRFRARSIFGLLGLAGVYGLLASLLVNPAVMLANVPLTLLSRVMGSQTLAGLAMLALFFALLSGRGGRWVFVGSIAAGLTWGVIGRWFVLATASTSGNLISVIGGTTPLPTTLLRYGLAALLLIVILWWLTARRSRGVAAAHLLLSPRGWVLLGVTLVALLFVRLMQNAIDSLSFTIILVLLCFVVALLWFHRGKRGVPYMERALPPQAPRLVFLAAAVALLVACVIGFHLPGGLGETDPLGFIGTLFTVFGAVWLPSMSLVLGGRAFLRQVRTQQM